MGRLILLLIAALIALRPTLADAASIKFRGDTVYVSGIIEIEDLSLAQYLFLFGPVVRNVSLDSRGGNVAVAQFAASIIAYRGLNTRVDRGKLCASACVLLLLAGKYRSVDPNARIGVHTAALDRQSDYVKRLNKLRRTGLKGVDASSIPEAIAAQVKVLSPYIDQKYLASLFKKGNGEKGQIYWVKQSQLRKLGIVVERLKGVVANEAAADAKLMKTRAVRQWDQLSDKRGPFGVVCNPYSGRLAGPPSNLNREVLALCGKRFTKIQLCEDVTNLIQTLDLPLLVDGQNEGFSTGASCKLVGPLD